MCLDCLHSPRSKGKYSTLGANIALAHSMDNIAFDLIWLHTITNDTDPGDWHLHSLLAQLTACIDSKPMDKPPAFYGEIKCK